VCVWVCVCVCVCVMLFVLEQSKMSETRVNWLPPSCGERAAASILGFGTSRLWVCVCSGEERKDRDPGQLAAAVQWQTRGSQYSRIRNHLPVGGGACLLGLPM
jgi:hypothetical protein